MKSLSLLTALALALPATTLAMNWRGDSDDNNVTISSAESWSELPDVSGPGDVPIVALPAPSPVPSTPHYLCEFEDPAECMWDYGEKRRLPRPGPSAPPEVDWARVVTIREVESINFAPPAIIMWPNTGDVLINLPTPVMTDATQRLYSLQFTTATIQVRATPFEYTWDFGDGTVETVDHPGLPDPQATYKHQYLSRADKNRITLTTTWSAEFLHPRTGAWIPIEGSVNTTSYSRWFTQKMAVPFLTDEAEKLDGH